MQTGKKEGTLVNQVYEQIKEDLARGDFKPGEKIVFREMAERYSVSETPVKQALNRLVTEGLVESIPRRGMQFRENSPSDFKETMDIRYILEDYFAPVVMEAVSFRSEVLERMEANIQAQYEAAEHLDAVSSFIEYYQLDHEFHRLYIKCSNNRKAVQVYDSIGAHTFGNFLYLKKPKEKIVSGIREHEDILDALKRQDLPALREAVRIHIVNAKTSVDYIQLEL